MNEFLQYSVSDDFHVYTLKLGQRRNVIYDPKRLPLRAALMGLGKQIVQG